MRHLALPIMIALMVPAASPAMAPSPRTSEFETLGELDRVDSETQAHDTAITDDRFERMTVQVRVGDSGPYAFLVDTGSERTALSRQVAARLGLAPSGNARLHSVTGSSQVATVRVPRLHLSGKPIDVADAPLLEQANIGADGILGTDSLRAQRLLFDFVTGTMTIVPSVQRITREERDAIVVEARRRNGRLILTQAKADGVPVTIVLDTGAQITMANEALRQALVSRRAIRQAGKVELLSVTGQKLIGDYAFLRNLDLGKVALADLATVFAEAHTFKTLGLQHRPAILLGMNALRGFERVSIDFERRQLRVITPQRSEFDGSRMASAIIPAD